MTNWQPIETAPRDGTPIYGQTAQGVEVAMFWGEGLLDDDGRDCGGWHASDEGAAPDCWTDGVCWARNDSGVPSDAPVLWRAR